jgi:hypothetical protein
VGRVTAIVVGSLLGLISLSLLAAGAMGLWYDRTQRDGGFVTSGVHGFSSEGSAVVTEETDLGSSGLSWVYPPWLLDEIRIRVTPSSPDAELFVGIAPSADADRYIAGESHTLVTDLWSDAVESVGGGTSASPPGGQDFWVASTSGPGPRTLVWEPEGGSWTVVVMNADARPGVALRADLGARMPTLPWIALGLLVGGAAFTLGAAFLIAGAIRGARTRAG